MKCPTILPALFAGSRIVRLLLLLLVLFLSADACGEETILVWKLKPGETFKVSRDQQSTALTSVANKPVRMTVSTAVSMTWLVEEVNAAGDAKITQTLDRIKTKMDAGNGVIEFDSAADAKPTGPVKMLADGVLPLVGGEFVITMTPRGAITNVDLSTRITKRAAAAEQTEVDKQATQGILQLLKQPLVLLPENEVDVGQSWESERDLPYSGGLLKQTLTYELAAWGEGDRARVATIRIAGNIASSVAAAGAPKLKSNALQGEAQFDAEAGRLIEMSLKQALELTSVYADTRLSAKTEVTVKTTISK